jgi:hypothetical protein
LKAPRRVLNRPRRFHKLPQCLNKLPQCLKRAPEKAARALPRHGNRERTLLTLREKSGRNQIQGRTAGRRKEGRPWEP